MCIYDLYAIFVAIFVDGNFFASLAFYKVIRKIFVYTKGVPIKRHRHIWTRRKAHQHRKILPKQKIWMVSRVADKIAGQKRVSSAKIYKSRYIAKRA